MYVPAHFAADEAVVEELLSRHGAADLVTMTDGGLVATMLPFVYDAERRVLQGHLARNNEQWQRPVRGEALVIMHGVDSYVTPSWYAAKREHGRVVPTWNYVTAHVYGELTVHDDPEWVGELVRRLTGLHEGPRSEPWSVEDAPEKFIKGQLRAIVGVELAITRVEAKVKLSQNRSAADVDGVIAGLRADGDERAAAAVEEHRPT
ncbi:FMN-binding negative transcriptional regulator [Kribbella sp. NPDC051587]|uniref:FMN-binding negative transcriptional regulator n=1 Tax=Kribbella sp. NPDC051587 TaxID=3364119 RepID=UPI0037A3FD66